MASYEIMRYSDGVWITYMDLALTRIKSIGPFKLKCEAERELEEITNKRKQNKPKKYMNELDQMRNYISRRINALDNEQISHIEVNDFDKASTKSAICAELYDLKAELNRLSWLSMESKLEDKI